MPGSSVTKVEGRRGTADSVKDLSNTHTVAPLFSYSLLREWLNVQLPVLKYCHLKCQPRSYIYYFPDTLQLGQCAIAQSRSALREKLGAEPAAGELDAYSRADVGRSEREQNTEQMDVAQQPQQSCPRVMQACHLGEDLDAPHAGLRHPLPGRRLHSLPLRRSLPRSLPGRGLHTLLLRFHAMYMYITVSFTSLGKRGSSRRTAEAGPCLFDSAH